MPPLPAAPRPDFRPDVEGLRGVAILLVVLFHAGVPALAGGFVGVDVFFVLSGFFITGLVARALGDDGTVDLPAFYAQRALRLLPVLLVVLAAGLGAVAWLYAPIDRASAAAGARAAALSASNRRVGARVGRSTYTSGDDPFLPTRVATPWCSKFYVVLPLLLVCSRRSSRASGADWRAERSGAGPTAMEARRPTTGSSSRWAARRRSPSACRCGSPAASAVGVLRHAGAGVESRLGGALAFVTRGPAPTGRAGGARGAPGCGSRRRGRRAQRTTAPCRTPAPRRCCRASARGDPRGAGGGRRPGPWGAPSPPGGCAGSGARRTPGTCGTGRW
jgi:hypothetical protein